MGWTCYNATFHKPNGSVDRKQELNSEYTWADETKTVSVLKSAMVGSTYYAALLIVDKETGEEGVEGVVCLTTSNKKEGWDFGYKPIHETMGPTEAKCPVSILDLLTPTDSEWANAWRQRCREYAEKQKAFQNLKEGDFTFSFPVRWSDGRTIEAGETVHLIRASVNGHRASWYLDWRHRLSSQLVAKATLEK